MPAEEKLKIIKDTPSRYHFKTKDDRHIDIEHKDKRLKFKLHKWNKEASLEVFLDMVEADAHEFIGNKVEVEDSKKKIRVYPIDTRSTRNFYGDTDDMIQCEDGGLRFELVLKGKPPTNSFTVPIKSKNLRFSYQPFLTEQDIAEGRSCPLNVEGSYAVYHTTKKNNQYMTGKAFHIYRPIVEDALGNKAWCSIEFNRYIDPTTLTLTIPQQFLDEATYPVTIDPDFGYTTIGASFASLALPGFSNRAGSAWTMPAPGGTANYIRARIYGDVVCDVKAFINQKDSGGANIHGQIAGPVENLNCAIAEHWEEFTLSGEALTAAVVYILNALGNEADMGKGDIYYIRQDTNGTGAIASYEEVNTYGAPESPWTDTPDVATRDYSIYCNYTAVAAVAILDTTSKYW